MDPELKESLQKINLNYKFGIAQEVIVEYGLIKLYNVEAIIGQQKIKFNFAKPTY